MRWCSSNSVCRFLYRNLIRIFVFLIIIFCIHHFLYLTRHKRTTFGTICYRNISPFTFIQPTNFTNGLNTSLNRTMGNILQPNIRWAQARFDKRRILKIYEWVWTSSLWDNLMDKFSVCLATQSSVDRIYSIAEVAEKWLGPISIAVYISSVNEWVILNLFVQYMQRCTPIFSETVSLHLGIPSNFTVPSDMNDINSINLDIDASFIDFDHPCGQPQEFLTKIMSVILPQGLDPNNPFPQNHMRNIARKTCGTPWVLMSDVDIIPRPNSSSLLQEFYLKEGSTCYKCAFVIPTFELKISVPYPKTKRELISDITKGHARQFHLKIYRSGHLATNYSLWISTNLEEEAIKVSHLSAVGATMNHYEPFYISSDDIPSHRERFQGYGFNRNSQVLEAKINGWTFKVLTPIFAIHWGLQTRQSQSQPQPLQNSYSVRTLDQTIQLRNRVSYARQNPRKMQNLKNSVLYNDFVSELLSGYNISEARKRQQAKLTKGKSTKKKSNE